MNWSNSVLMVILKLDSIAAKDRMFARDCSFKKFKS